MDNEWARMLAGKPYDPGNPALVAARQRARSLCQRLCALSPYAVEEERALLADLFGADIDVSVTPPFHCDYGVNIHLGRGVYFNFDCVILDVALVSIGDRVLFGPGVHVYTAMHPMDSVERAAGLESGEPVRIGDDVWLGGGAIICPGASIGERSVIGAGSVVVKDVPPDVFAAGNPCRVIRFLERQSGG